jgi:hypothetical protein
VPAATAQAPSHQLFLSLAMQPATRGLTLAEGGSRQDQLSRIDEGLRRIGRRWSGRGSHSTESDPVVPAPAPWVRALTSRSMLLSRLFLRQTDRMTRKWAEPVYRLRESLGLPPGGNPILAGQHSPDQVLALFSRLLNAPHPDWPLNTLVTGGLTWLATLHCSLEQPRRFAREARAHCTRRWRPDAPCSLFRIPTISLT